MLDANQRWEVKEAIEWVTKLAEFKPLWIEEPTSPDDILGHATIAKVSCFYFHWSPEFLQSTMLIYWLRVIFGTLKRSGKTVAKY